VLADDVPAGEQHWVVLAGCRFLGHWAHEHIVEFEPFSKVDLDGKFFGAPAALFLYDFTHFRELRDCVDASFNCLEQG